MANDVIEQCTMLGPVEAFFDGDRVSGRYVIRYQIITTVPPGGGISAPRAWGALTILTYASLGSATPHPIPKRFQPYNQDSVFPTVAVEEVDLSSVAKTFTLVRKETSTERAWICDVGFAPYEPGEFVKWDYDEEEFLSNPLDWPPVFNLEASMRHRQVRKGYNWTAVRTFAGQLIDDEALVARPITNAVGNTPITGLPWLESEDTVLVVRKNYATLEEIDILRQTFKHTTNKQPWFGAEPGHAKFLSIRIIGERIYDFREFHSSATYYTAEMRIMLRPYKGDDIFIGASVSPYDLVIANEDYMSRRLIDPPNASEGDGMDTIFTSSNVPTNRPVPVEPVTGAWSPASVPTLNYIEWGILRPVVYGDPGDPDLGLGIGNDWPDELTDTI